VDLRERGAGTQRHPWETARVEAVKSIIRRLEIEKPRVLDIGCGDGFVLQELGRSLEFRQALAYDLRLTDDLIDQLATPQIRFVRDLAAISADPVDLALFLDVLEHIEHPTEYLRNVVADQLASRGWVVITVPAFQALFTRHDRDLLHFRRYSRDEIAEVARGAGLEVVDSGYLFPSLVVPRAVAALRERALPPGKQANDVASDIGIGNWNGSPLLTRALHGALCWDNRLALAAHDVGLILPGLSAWLTCRKPS
jgi:SAM-dependent methyltransferase